MDLAGEEAVEAEAVVDSGEAAVVDAVVKGVVMAAVVVVRVEVVGAAGLAIEAAEEVIEAEVVTIGEVSAVVVGEAGVARHDQAFSWLRHGCNSLNL